MNLNTKDSRYRYELTEEGLLGCCSDLWKFHGHGLAEGQGSRIADPCGTVDVADLRTITPRS